VAARGRSSEKLDADRFAKTLTGVQLDTSKLTGLQLTYSKFEFDGGINPTFTEGPFGLEVASIELYN